MQADPDVDEQTEEGGSDEFVGQLDKGIAEQERQRRIGSRGLALCSDGRKVRPGVKADDEQSRAHRARRATCHEGKSGSS